MTNLVTSPTWHEDINQVDTNEPIIGGDGGNANLATRQLAERTDWLKQELEGIDTASGLEGHVNNDNPHTQYVLKKTFDDAIEALTKRIDDLVLSGGAGMLLSRLESRFSGTTNGYSLVNSTIARVYVTNNYVVDSEFNLIPLGDYATPALMDVHCQAGSSSRILELNYPESFDPELHEVRSSHPNFSEKEDGTGIQFVLPYSSESDEDGARKYTISANYYFEVVKK